jgi:hypothetical protein
MPEKSVLNVIFNYLIKNSSPAADKNHNGFHHPLYLDYGKLAANGKQY